MDNVIVVCAVLCILLQIVLLIVFLRGKSDDPRKAVREMLGRMQKEEQKLRREQSAQTNETIRLSMQTVSDNLSQNQSQTHCGSRHCWQQPRPEPDQQAKKWACWCRTGSLRR